MALLRRHKQSGPGIRRQWGADSHENPMPAVPRIAGEWAMAFGRAAVVLTVAAWVALVVTVLNGQVIEGVSGHASLLETVGFLIAVSLLAASATAYLFGRLGFYYRARQHRRMPRAKIEEFFAHRQPTLTALVPSYQEEPGVILMTLLSTALQEYPDLRVVLLIDDPPNPRYAGPRRLLDSALALPAEVERLLSEPRRRFDLLLERFESTVDPDGQTSYEDLLALAGEYEYAATWIQSLAKQYKVSDHNERFFTNHVLGRLSADLALTGRALRAAADDDPGKLPPARLAQLYRRLAWTFRAEISSFQRKRYASLSAEPNKAMNLNSYIGLMGDSYLEVQTPAGLNLLPAGEATPDLVVPECDYVMTIDADSVIMPEYCLRLVHLLEREENSHIAVAQSPYSAFPGAATRIERIAGATTDLQHIIHQGMTYHSASFWVGANAILRKLALDDIEEIEYKGEFQIRRYISDRTVIEDTESTIDLAARGWTLHNYPERLAYSATPPDFGSLCIQRHRWANGGLLIIPKLVRAVRRRRQREERTSIGELLLRMNYMASVFWSSLFVLCLMVIPFSGRLISPLTYAVAAPYFLAMAVDLHYCGYRRLDAARIYGLNLLLLPVNLAGSLSSIVQALTGAKGKFIRTPKVRDRTIPAFAYVVLPYALVGFSIYTFKLAWDQGLWSNSIFAAINGLLGAYAIVAFIGLRNSLVDIWTNVLSWLYKPQSYNSTPARTRGPAADPEAQAVSNWELVLYMGFADRRRRARDAAGDLSDPDRAPLPLPVSAPVVDPGQIGQPQRLPQDARAGLEAAQRGSH
ncbi:MAG TPA: glycosyltransferase family 2 protein [Solirubrobacteraceae bacterium]|jgi:cellulose synthase/poly-beta-1,6-N-acetylglucosamine synthase-like glycosyltransferase|nr:glycosyltransferase family 2 protein [Solirubrobacteraceae bacterium]